MENRIIRNRINGELSVLLKLFILDLENKINVDQCIVVIGNTYSLSCAGSKCEFSFNTTSHITIDILKAYSY